METLHSAEGRFTCAATLLQGRVDAFGERRRLVQGGRRLADARRRKARGTWRPAYADGSAFVAGRPGESLPDASAGKGGEEP